VAGFVFSGDAGMRQEHLLWHNPRCSKSRAALALLAERGIEPTIRDYLRDPPSAAEVEALLAMLGLGARQLLRTGEPAYAELGLDDPALDASALVAAMSAHPQLIERPILVVRTVTGGRAVIGRPPERVLGLL
jgi:arsenate reductase